jgi:hypothetical protein
LLALGLILLASVSPARAEGEPTRAEPVEAPIKLEGPLKWNNRLDNYIDHDESRDTFRASESLLSSQLRTQLDLPFSQDLSVKLGLFFAHASGFTQLDPDQMNFWRPVAALHYRTDYGTAIGGTLDTVERHGLLDALEAVEFEIIRPIEYGGQWLYESEFSGIDQFINFQQLKSNDGSRPTVYDYGGTASVRLWGPLTGELQLHGTHNGNADQLEGGPGLLLAGDLGKTIGWSQLSCYGLGSKDHGGGVLTELKIQPRGLFELYGGFWRSNDYVTVDGDRNYEAARLEYVAIRRRLPLWLNVMLDVEFENQWVDGDEFWYARAVGRLRFDHLL